MLIVNILGRRRIVPRNARPQLGKALQRVLLLDALGYESVDIRNLVQTRRGQPLAEGSLRTYRDRIRRFLGANEWLHTELPKGRLPLEAATAFVSEEVREELRALGAPAALDDQALDTTSWASEIQFERRMQMVLDHYFRRGEPPPATTPLSFQMTHRISENLSSKDRLILLSRKPSGTINEDKFLIHELEGSHEAWLGDSDVIGRVGEYAEHWLRQPVNRLAQSGTSELIELAVILGYLRHRGSVDGASGTHEEELETAHLRGLVSGNHLERHAKWSRAYYGGPRRAIPHVLRHLRRPNVHALYLASELLLLAQHTGDAERIWGTKDLLLDTEIEEVASSIGKVSEDLALDERNQFRIAIAPFEKRLVQMKLSVTRPNEYL